ncbi:hypothetical protein AvCA_11720 [Azotobacter vinelandii CA]|uniref:Uncharacterized protein n=2 Tax=Azotobacter vinelandii TaxID=354 RepID=C1DPG9_AZOVD|nr:hypothetical protein Avin_11720 [Azotobacter vinelandii DJ]AGK15386.1 hypothetical protein AvCA_11720 [Azotobacter vinelandii CA]AGK19778.1 hypothetical protein AvCA6_11720 [Azotobacter vinelandii CA6]
MDLVFFGFSKGFHSSNNLRFYIFILK